MSGTGTVGGDHTTVNYSQKEGTDDGLGQGLGLGPTAQGQGLGPGGGHVKSSESMRSILSMESSTHTEQSTGQVTPPSPSPSMHSMNTPSKTGTYTLSISVQTPFQHILSVPVHALS